MEGGFGRAHRVASRSPSVTKTGILAAPAVSRCLDHRFRRAHFGRLAVRTVRAGIGRHGRSVFLPRRVDDAASASSASSDGCRASRSVLRDRRPVCRSCWSRSAAPSRPRASSVFSLRQREGSARQSGESAWPELRQRPDCLSGGLLNRRCVEQDSSENHQNTTCLAGDWRRSSRRACGPR